MNLKVRARAVLEDRCVHVCVQYVCRAAQEPVGACCFKTCRGLV